MQDQEEKTAPAPKGSKGPKVTYDLVKNLVEQYGVDIFATNAQKLLLLAGHGGTGTYQKYLDMLKIEHIKAMEAADVSVVPTAPVELTLGLWEFAYATAQAQLSKHLTRITGERDGLRMMSDSQAADIAMYVATNEELEEKVDEYEPKLIEAQKAVENALNQVALDKERHQHELDAMAAEIKRITDDAIKSAEIQDLTFKIERQLLESTIAKSDEKLSEYRANFMVASGEIGSKKAAKKEINGE